jgi:hypothetical protein
MLRDAFARRGRGQKPVLQFLSRLMEFSTFSFSGSIPPVRLGETGKDGGLRRLSTACTFHSGVPARQRGAPVVGLDLNRGLRARLLALIRGQNWP